MTGQSAENDAHFEVGVFEGTRWHMHGEPVCADPDCVTYLTREQVAEICARRYTRVLAPRSSDAGDPSCR